jgi:hypothetical protein
LFSQYKEEHKEEDAEDGQIMQKVKYMKHKNH